MNIPPPWIELPKSLESLQNQEITVGCPYGGGAQATIIGIVKGDEIVTLRGNDYQLSRFTHYRIED